MSLLHGFMITRKSEVMLFEVYKNDIRMMYTDDEECIPSNDIIKNMKAAGYKVLLDGKIYKTK